MAIRCCGEAVLKIRSDGITYVAMIQASGYTYLVKELQLPGQLAVSLPAASPEAFSVIARLAVEKALTQQHGHCLEEAIETDDLDKPLIRRTPRAGPERIPNLENL